jgi:4-amino-4-deoxy-L-arabinose transferase-like glycosyltransferase
VVGLIATVTVTLTYALIVFNRSLPVQDGWFQIVADRMGQGQVPYRDFHLFLQPGYPLLISALVDVFGHGFIVIRALGVAEKVFLAFILYLLLARLGRSWAACCAAIVTLFVFSSFTADGVESYLQVCMILALCGAYLAGLSLEASRPRNGLWLAGISGVLLGLAFFIKQTSGFMIALAVLVVMAFVLLHRREPRRWLRVLVLVGGFLVAVAVFCVWLLAHSALGAYIGQVWLGSTSKGSFLNIAFGFLHRSLPWTWALGLIIIVTIAAPWLYLARRSGTEGLSRTDRWPRADIAASVGVGAMFLFAILAPLLKRDSVVFFATSFDFFATKRMLIAWAFLGTAIVTLAVAYEIERRGATRRRVWLLLLAMVSGAAAWSMAMSFTIDEATALPCLGFFIVLALDAPAPRRLAFLKNTVLLGLCCLAVLLVAGSRYATPYYWWGWLEPDIASATHKLPYPQAAGLRVSSVTADAYRRIIRDIDRYAPPRNGSVYAFPHMGVFYVLSDRYPTTDAVVDYWDVCPDEIARRDAARLRWQLPEVIVWMEIPEDVWQFHENGFRGGRRSGQRAIMAEVTKMVAEGIYRQVDRVSNPGCYSIAVYARSDRIAGQTSN